MTTKSYIVIKDKAQTLTNKTINADSNVIQNLEAGNFKAQATSEAGKCFGVKSDGSIGLISSSTAVDNTTIEVNSDSKLAVKNGGLTVPKFSSSAISTSVPVTGAVDTKVTTEKAVSDSLSGKVDIANPLEFSVKAGTYSLTGSSDGSLAWKGYNVLTKDDIADSLMETSTSMVLSAKQGNVLALTKENTINKTTTIDSSSSDTQYPSAKAVYDSTASNIIGNVSGSAGQVLARNSANNGLEFKDVATGTMVTSWQTTPDDSHYPSEKLTKDSLDDKVNKTNNTSFSITAGEKELYGSTDGTFKWDGNQIETQSNKVSAWTISPTDDEYPTAKLVSDSLDEKVNINNALTFDIKAGDKTLHGTSTGDLTWEGDAILDTGDIIDDLDIPATTKALSAKQGKVLNESKEAVANKVTSWQTTPDDTHYPSEKLTKSSIDEKLNITNETVFQITAGDKSLYGYHTGDLFWNGHSVLTTSDIVDNLTSTSNIVALSAKQGKVLNDTKEAVANKVTSISSSSTDTEYPTAKAVYDAIPSTSDFEQTANKVTTISSSSTDTEYPSAKAVYANTSDKLPLAGGTMTGTIVSGASLVLSRDVNTSMMYISGGSTKNDGATVQLSGTGRGTDPGAFWLKATDGTSNYVLLGKPDGTLVWCGKPVLCVAMPSSSGTYTLKCVNGTLTWVSG